MSTSVENVAGGEPSTAVRSSLSEKIYADLRLALMSGVYEPGDRLNIRKLGTVSQTSTTPVREAVMQLVREGALELRLGYQPRVPILSADTYMKIREVRAPLERLATELATIHMTGDLLDQLARIDQLYVEAERQGVWKNALSANQEFHFLIYNASKNDVLVRTIENLWLLTGPSVHKQYLSPNRIPSDGALHSQILDALSRRAPSEAGDLIVQDMRQGAIIILEHLRNPGGRRPDRKVQVARS